MPTMKAVGDAVLLYVRKKNHLMFLFSSIHRSLKLYTYFCYFRVFIGSNSIAEEVAKQPQQQQQQQPQKVFPSINEECKLL